MCAVHCRVFLTLTQALALGFGGNPYGPAGTGKTESVKALGQALGRQVRTAENDVVDCAHNSHCMHRMLCGNECPSPRDSYHSSVVGVGRTVLVQSPHPSFRWHVATNSTLSDHSQQSTHTHTYIHIQRRVGNRHNRKPSSPAAHSTGACIQLR